ncbi:MAG: carboxypeptidase regulatory-like domain-containing protein, partial [Verrucomicrobia bacterium]|nr:carboxypeptidase regulatory-like domain-containing protein [Verrucomicrobiota bacterium]
MTFRASSFASSRLLRRVFICLVLTAFSSRLPAAEAPRGGTLSGNVSNAATGNLLEGARVELPSLGLFAFSDSTGRYVLDGVPAGTHEVVASYLGLDAVKATITVAPAQRAVRNFDLTAAFYKLAAFQVTGEREGNALALTAQKNAPNVKNIAAIDAYGVGRVV